MSVPPAPYLRLTSFVGASPYRDATLGVAMDAEFDAVQTAINAIENRLSLIQRDDGALLNSSVGPDQLGGGLTGQRDFTLVTSLGIGSTNIAPNVLTVKGPSALFSNAQGGGDFKLFLSKAAAGNSASLVFQDALSTRADIGLFGDDNLHFRVSSDGTSFTDALGISTAGVVTALTPPSVDSSTRLATTAFVATSFAPKLNPTFTGTLTAAAMSISGAVTGGGVTSLFASPPPIGGTTPGAGSFTTLTTTSFTTLMMATIGDAPTDTISFYGAAAVARRAAGNNPAVPVGGVGTAAGGFDTAAHRDTFIGIVTEIRATLVGLGLMPAT